MKLLLTATARPARALRAAACALALACAGCVGGSSSGGGALTDPEAPPVSLGITTTSLPNAQVGVGYNVTLTAAGGTTPYGWALSGGTLPQGLSFDGTTGTLSGTPTGVAGGTALTFTVTDEASHSASATLALTVLGQALQLTVFSLPSGHVGTPYDATLSAKGGTAPYSWQLTAGTLPAGLSLAAASGVISGTPTASTAGTQLTFQVTDSAQPAATLSKQLTLVVTAVPLAISTTSLPAGQVGVPYSATLGATGGTGAISWVLASGPLPVGLTLNGATGVISGTPTVATFEAPVTFTATDSGTPPQTQSAAFGLTIATSGIAVNVSPARAGLTVGQALALSAATNDPAGVTWSISPAGGSFSAANSLNGVPVNFTAPATAGVYTITATSRSDGTRSASLTVGVTDLAGVYTYHNNGARDGSNVQEYALTPANVNNANFGKLFSCPVDGAVYAQPLWVANLSIAGLTRNVVFVATAHDSLYAFDADAVPCKPLWQVSLIDTSHGAGAGETTVPAGGSGFLVGQGFGDITPEVGVTGTPVIDPAAGILYVVSKSVNSGHTAFYQRLHAIDLASGAERAGAPVALSGSYLADSGTAVGFDVRQELQRCALALAGGTVYVAFAAHEDAAPWYGWVLGYRYNGAGFTQNAVLNVAPNTAESGIWMSGGGPSVDSSGHLYVITGNGQFDAANTSGTSDDYGDSFLQLTLGTGQAGLGVSSYFTPTDQLSDYQNDKDFGAGGAALVLNLSGTGGTPQHLVVGGGKDGALYVLNGDAMGGAGDAQAWQKVSVGHPIFATAAFWNNTLFLAPLKSGLQAYSFNSSTLKLASSATQTSANTFGFPGATPAVSASDGANNGIVWAIDSSAYCTPQSGGCGPAVLHAYAAGALGSELWNSSQIGTDAAGNAVKFTVPTIANGKVYLGSRGNNTGGVYGSTSVSGQLDVYGLKSN